MKRIQGFICGFLAAIVLLVSIPVLAETIQATFNVINIKINGKLTVKAGESFTLANGNKVPYTIVYNGTTYLPLRETIRLVGKELKFDGETSTADIVATEQKSVESQKTEGDIVSEKKYATRAELARFFIQSFDLQNGGTKYELKDVPETNEYYNDICIVIQQGIMQSTRGLFTPESATTKWAFANYLGRALKLDLTADEPEVKINDIADIPNQNVIRQIVSLGLMELDENGNFSPREFILTPLVPNPDLKNYIQK